jgi:hypothetical protein
MALRRSRVRIPLGPPPKASTQGAFFLTENRINNVTTQSARELGELVRRQELPTTQNWTRIQVMIQ